MAALTFRPSPRAASPSWPGAADSAQLAGLMNCALAPEAADLLAAGSGPDLPRIGNYELLAELGRGGMGVIYKAQHIHTGQLVAVKVVLSHITHKPELLARFRREAQAAARLDHPHVLPIYEVNEEADGLPFFTMKLALGGSLAARCATLRDRPREIAALLGKVARAAAHAHERGVLHRDLTPGNVLFDALGEPLVSDFGLAAWLHQPSDLSRTVSIMGTPGYLAPEYRAGRPRVLEASSDIYSLGVMLFELLAGRLPFQGADAFDALRQAAERPAPRLRSLVPHAHRELEIICARCLEIVPAQRYRSAAALAEDLERWLEGRPILARSTPRIVVAWKLARRRPAISLASSLCVSLGVVSLSLQLQLGQATSYDRTITVLPAEDLDELRHDTALARRATDLCLASAKTVKNLHVITARTASDPLPRHGALSALSQELGGRYLLSATVRHREDAVRLVVQIIDARADAILQTQVLDSPALQEGAATLFGEAIRAATQPSAKEKSEATSAANPSSNEAIQLYLQAGMQHMERGLPADVDLAIAAFKKAVSLQPSEPAALSKLAGALAFRSLGGGGTQWMDEALTLAGKAIKLRPELASPHRTLAYIRTLRGEFLLARDEALQGFELDPESATGASSTAEVFAGLGAFDQALAWNQKALSRDRSPGLLLLYRGHYLAAMGEMAGARQAYQDFMEVRANLHDGPQALANLDLLEGRTASALEGIRALHKNFPLSPAVTQNCASIEFCAGNFVEAERLFRGCADVDDAGLNSFLSVRAISALGFIASEQSRAESRGLIERALQLDNIALGEASEDARLHFEKAANLSMLDRLDESLASLRAAARYPQWTNYQIKLDPRLRSVRKAPDFPEIVAAVDEKIRQARERYAKR